MRQRLLTGFGLLALVVTLPWLLWLFVLDPVIRAPRMVALLIFTLIACNPLWLRWLPVRAVAAASLVTLHLGFGFVVLWNGGLAGPTALVVSCLPVLTAVLLGIRAGWIDLVGVGLAAAGLERLTLAIDLPQTAPPEVGWLVRLMSLIVGAALSMIAVTASTLVTRRHHEILAQARDGALAASRAKSRFLSTMSHELRTPMVGVVGAAELLGRSNPTPEQTALIELLLQSARAQIDLVGDVLDLARIEEGRLEVEPMPMRLRELLDELDQVFRIACREKGVTLRVTVDPAVPTVLALDRGRLRQVLSNLLDNAVKFTSEGSVALEARWQAASERLEVFITDTGVGFPNAMAEDIFEPFLQGDGSTTRRFGGSGLGLAICRRLIEAMGGTIHARTTDTGGAEFRLTLPTPQREIEAGAGPASPSLADDSVKPVAAANGALAARPASGSFVLPSGDLVATTGAESVEPIRLGDRQPRVLFADDDPVSRLIGEALLEQIGCTVLTASSGAAALEIARSQSFDLAILDMHMPELDGPACAQALRALPAPISNRPILALTADAVGEHHADYRRRGIDAVYLKPITLPSLRAAIVSALGVVSETSRRPEGSETAAAAQRAFD